MLQVADASKHPWFSLDLPPNNHPDPYKNSKRMTLHIDGDLVAQSLKTFKEQTQVYRTVMLAVAFGMGSDSVGGLREMFGKMDKDNDGTISLKEFQESMVRNHFPL